LLPSLNLTANYNRNIGASGNQRDYTAFATVGLSWPIFDSGVTRARVQQAREDERQAEIQQEQLELGVSLEVRQAMTNLVNAKSTLQVAQTQVTVATETYRLAQVRLQAGEGTSLEVTNALTDLTRAQNQLANARYNYLTAYAQLQRAVAADDPNAAPPEQGTGKK
jgi:outer membrane protein TolC